MGYVMGLDEIGRTQTAEVGGKGANLGELTRIDGVLDRLAAVRPDDRAAIDAVSAEIRGVVEEIPLPDDLVAAIGAALARLGARETVAPEDWPDAPVDAIPRPQRIVWPARRSAPLLTPRDFDVRRSERAAP